jgi:glyoxylate reductase
MKNIFITRPIPGSAVKTLEAKGYEVTVGKYKKPITEKELIKELKKKKYDAVVTLLTDKVGAKVFDASPSTKIFSNYSIGFDNFDIAEATKRGITLTNAPGDYVDGIAEHTIALILSLMSRIVEADAFVRKGKYKGWDPMLFIGDDIKGKTVAIIGTGRIGERVVHKLHLGFEANIIYYDLVRNERIEKDCGAKFVSSIDEAISTADVVSLHVPLTKETHHLIDKKRLEKMKNSAYLINTSRGAVIDEKALVEALKKNKIRGAGLDVYEFEPKLAKGLNKLSNVVLSPHIASAQHDAREEMSKVVAENVIDFLEGKAPKNKINN